MKSAVQIRAVLAITLACWFGTQHQLAAQTNPVISPPRPSVSAEPAPAKAAPSQRPVPFRGTIKSVDKTAKTFVIGTRTFALTPKSRFLQGEKPVELTEALAGQWVTGSYLRTGDAKLPVISVYVGGKTAAASAGTGTKQKTTTGTAK